MNLFFIGMIGATTVLFQWPWFFILNYTGLETFMWPPPNVFYGLLITVVRGIFPFTLASPTPA